MKYIQILRFVAVSILLSLLMITIPAAPVQAAASITLSPEEGSIGDSITIVGSGFNKSTATTDKYAAVFFSSDEATTLDDIDVEVTHYEMVKEGVWLDQDGEFEATFKVPQRLNDGDDEEYVEGGTYYVYVCHYLGTIDSPLSMTKAAKDEIRRQLSLLDNSEVAVRVLVVLDRFTGFVFDLEFDQQEEDDKVYTIDGIKVVIDKSMAEYIKGMKVDFNPEIPSFTFNNENPAYNCVPGSKYNCPSCNLYDPDSPISEPPSTSKL